MTDLDEPAAALRRSLPHLDAPERAATELVLFNGHWPRHSVFLRECVRSTGTLTVIAWPPAGMFIARRPRCSPSELAVLELAHFIATDPFRLFNFGTAHREAAVDALAAALGVTSPGGEARRG